MTAKPSIHVKNVSDFPDGDHFAILEVSNASDYVKSFYYRSFECKKDFLEYIAENPLKEGKSIPIVAKKLEIRTEVIITNLETNPVKIA